jgi:hypothetical protein
MTNPIIRIHNTETNEIIDREMTNDELAIYEQEKQTEQERLLAKQVKNAAKTDLLAKLGITEDEARLLLG